MSLQFHKMHGAGNDFMLLDLRSPDKASATSLLTEETIRAWGDRHRGVGFDQLLVLTASTAEGEDATVHIWNSDGSTAEQCGNGMRAIGLYLSDREPERQQFVVMTAAGAIDLLRPDQAVTDVAVNMGEANFAPAEVPYTGAPGEDGWYDIIFDGQPVRFGVVSMGNPHAVVVVEDCDNAPLDTLGRLLRDHPAFPESCNVGFAELISESHINLRVLERGADETLACGTGACAAVAWLANLKIVGDRVRVSMAGGTLEVASNGGHGDITLTGPATHVFEGMIE